MFPGDAIVQALGTTRDAKGVVSPADPAQLNDRIEMFIGLAEDEADAYISSQYVLPLKSVPPVIKPFIGDMARKWIYSGKVDEAVRERHQAAISFLNKVARGDVMLGVPDQDKNVAANSNLPMVSARPAHRGRAADSLEGWHRSFDGGGPW